MQSGARRPALTLLLAIAAISLGAGAWFFRHASQDKASNPSPFAGSDSCASCHPSQYSQWLQSNHRHAMEKPSGEAVLGNFDGAEFSYFGRTTRFTRKGDSFFVTTENQQGQPETF